MLKSGFETKRRRLNHTLQSAVMQDPARYISGYPFNSLNHFIEFTLWISVKYGTMMSNAVAPLPNRLNS